MRYEARRGRAGTRRLPPTPVPKPDFGPLLRQPRMDAVQLRPGNHRFRTARKPVGPQCHRFHLRFRHDRLAAAITSGPRPRRDRASCRAATEVSAARRRDRIERATRLSSSGAQRLHGRIDDSRSSQAAGRPHHGRLDQREHVDKGTDRHALAAAQSGPGLRARVAVSDPADRRA